MPEFCSSVVHFSCSLPWLGSGACFFHQRDTQAQTLAFSRFNNVDVRLYVQRLAFRNRHVQHWLSLFAAETRRHLPASEAFDQGFFLAFSFLLLPLLLLLLPGTWERQWRQRAFYLRFTFWLYVIFIFARADGNKPKLDQSDWNQFQKKRVIDPLRCSFSQEIRSSVRGCWLFKYLKALRYDYLPLFLIRKSTSGSITLFRNWNWFQSLNRFEFIHIGACNLENDAN